MNAFLVDLRKNVVSPKFLISVLLMTMLCLMADAPQVSAREPLSVFDEIVKMRKEIWLDKGIDFSSASIFYQFDNSLWYSIVLPIIAAFPIVYNFSDEWFGDNYIMTLSRCGYKKYTFSKLSVAFITGFLVAVVGIAVFGIIVTFIFPSANDFIDGGSWNYDYAYTSPLYAMTAKVFNNAIVCGTYAFMAIFICLILKDKFFTLSIFMVINYFSMKLNIKFSNSVSLSNSKSRAIKALFPDDQINIYSIFPNELHISFYWYAAIILVIYLIITTVSFFLIKRRYTHAS
ncbi:MAG: hypothetical protein NC320_12705 [Clostridium sp.]|nr:hypothetical protein [Clostridium sp.]